MSNMQQPPVEFQKLSDRNPGESLQVLYYGRSKAGKTYFAGTAGPRTLFINTGDGLETLLSPAFRSKHPDAAGMVSVDIRENKRTRGKSSVAVGIDLVTDTIDWYFENHLSDFDTLVVDDATSIGDFCMLKGLEISGETGRSKMAQALVIKHGLVIPAQQDYGMEMALVEDFVKTTKNLCRENKKNFILTAHELTLFKPGGKQGEEVISGIFPQFTGKGRPDRIPRLFDEVWRAEVVNGSVHRCHTVSDGVFLAGTRHGGILKEVESNPNFLDFLRRIRDNSTPTRK